MSDQHAYERVWRDFSDLVRLHTEHLIPLMPRAPESPIERMMLIGIVGFSIAVPRYTFEGRDGLVEDSAKWPSIHVECQASVLDKYRADFLLTVSLDGKAIGKVVVECDGHMFHERTKDQAARDRSRDREMTLAGFTVLRFTGSEIYRDVVACSEQVHNACWGIYTAQVPEGGAK